MKLFGRPWDRATLMRHVGDVGQLGGATPLVYDEGPERGTRAIEVRTGTGFSFTVLPDRGLDIFHAELHGAALSWRSGTGPIAPAFHETTGTGWLRGFPGGLLVTCGLTHVGPPADGHGLHGRASYTPARAVAITQGWQGDEYPIEVRGSVRETSVFGHDLRLTRRITTALGQSGFQLTDEIENLGHAPAPLMLLYHVNGGFPLVTADAELLLASVQSTRAGALVDPREFARFQSPTAGYAEQVFFHQLRSARDGRTTVALINQEFSGGRGLGYALRFPIAQMPCFTQWKLMDQGHYVVGTEPGNVNPEPRALLEREKRVPMIGPGEKKFFTLEFTALGSATEIAAVAAEIRAL